jgi:low temperature requirement protein LtrA
MEELQLRRLWGPTRLWNKSQRLDYEERSSSWWELFFDLVMCAVISSISDVLLEDFSYRGALLSFLYFSVYYQSWLKYVVYSTWFHYNSLFHSVQLMLYILLTAAMCVFTSNGWPIPAFFVCAILQRFALIFMYAVSAYSIVKARRSCAMRILNCAIGIAFYIAILVVDYEIPPDDLPWIGCILWAIAVTMENLDFGFTLFFIAKPKRLLLNIDHYTDRLSALIFIVLGEAVVSSMIQLDSSLFSDESSDVRMYLVMAFMFSSLFGFALMVFHAVPPREMHALRRSASSGIMYSQLMMFLAISLIVFGVAIKQAVVAVPQLARSTLLSESYGRAEVFTLLIALAVALALLIVIRLLHWWGRSFEFDRHSNFLRLRKIWWGGVFAGPFLCLLMIWPSIVEPITPLVPAAACAAVVWGLVIFESSITHKLSQYADPDKEPLN